MTGPETASKPVTSATPRWIKVLLAGSLAVNLAVIGGAIGLILDSDGPPPKPPGEGMASVGSFVRALEKPHRREFLGSIEKATGGKPPSKEEFKAKAMALISLIRAEPFDVDALSAKITEQSSRFETARMAGDAALLRIIDGMSPEERQAYADRLEERLNRGPGKPSKMEGPGGDRDKPGKTHH